MGRIRGYRRTVAAAVVLVLTIAVAGALGTPARSQSPAFPGTARASGSIASIVPAVGGLDFAIRVGSAATDLQNTVASAQAQSINLGLIETVLTSEDCTGSQTLTREQIPQPTRVDNRNGDTTATSDEIPIPAGITFGGGREHVEATTQPRSLARSIPSAVELGPLVVTAGEATSTSQVIDGHTYEARAVVESSISLAGIKLSGMRWEALHRIGAEPAAEGSFSLGDAGGVPLGVEALGPLADLINVLLAPLGMTLTFPTVQVITEPRELVRVTPLAITMRDTPVGAALLNPLLEALSGQKAALFDQIVAVACQLGSVLFVGDVGLTIASGNGSLQVAVGGVQAVAGVIDATDREVSSETTQPEDTPPDGTTTTTEVTEGADGPTQTEQVVLAASPESGEPGCRSLHPFQWPPCSRGAAALAGLIGLAFLATMATLDWRHQRRLKAPA